MIHPPEPDVASSDATNMECTLRREEDEFVINGKKWWSSGMSIYISLSHISKIKTEIEKLKLAYKTLLKL